MDIHGLTEMDAKRQLEQFLSRADASLKEVVVIHGYHNGQSPAGYGTSEAEASPDQRKAYQFESGATRLLLK